MKTLAENTSSCFLPKFSRDHTALSSGATPLAFKKIRATEPALPQTACATRDSA